MSKFTYLKGDLGGNIDAGTVEYIVYVDTLRDGTQITVSHMDIMDHSIDATCTVTIDNYRVCKISFLRIKHFSETSLPAT